jgi:inorganic pyrophosphatase
MPSVERSAVARLGTYDPATGALNVVIETPAGCRNKFEYDPASGLFTLSSVLPDGAVFPYDFGFIPGTRGQDGDPLDVLVLMDEPAFTGCLLRARLIGVMEAQETEDGRRERNDRLLAVAEESHDHRDIHNLNQLSPNLLKEIEYFFVSYEAIKQRKFKVLGQHGPKRAENLVEAGRAALRATGPAKNGKTSKRKEK